MLAHQLYGDIGLREFGDLDLLVQFSDLGRVTDILLRMGYRRQDPLEGKRAGASRRSTIHEVFIPDRASPAVEIHWDILPRYYSIPLDLRSLWKRRSSFLIAGRKMPCFAPEDLFLILCLHAWKHQYERLVWLVDLAMMAERNSGFDWGRLAEQAGRWRIQRIWSLSFSLLKELLDVRSVCKADAPSSSPPLRRAASYVRERALHRAEGEKPPKREEVPYCLLTRECWRDRLHYLLRLVWVWVTPTRHEWSSIPLTDRFFFLYYLVRPIRLAGRYLSR